MATVAGDTLKILYMFLYDFGGFRLVECSYHVFTWGSMSQFRLNTTKNVPFGNAIGFKIANDRRNFADHNFSHLEISL